MPCSPSPDLPLKALDLIFQAANLTTKHKLQQASRHLRSLWLAKAEGGKQSPAEEWLSGAAARLWGYRSRGSVLFKAVKLKEPHWSSSSKSACVVTIELNLLARHLKDLCALAASFTSSREFREFARTLCQAVDKAMMREISWNEGLVDMPEDVGCLIFKLRVVHNSSQPLSDEQADNISELFWELPSLDLGERLVEWSFYESTWSLVGRGPKASSTTPMAWHVSAGLHVPALA